MWTVGTVSPPLSAGRCHPVRLVALNSRSPRCWGGRARRAARPFVRVASSLASSAVARLTAMRSGGPKTDRGGVRLADFLHANVRGFAALQNYFGGTGQAKLCPHCWHVTIISCRPSTAWIGNLLARWAPVGHGMLTMLSQRSFQLPHMRSTPHAIAILCHHVVERASGA